MNWDWLTPENIGAAIMFTLATYSAARKYLQVFRSYGAVPFLKQATPDAQDAIKPMVGKADPAVVSTFLMMYDQMAVMQKNGSAQILALEIKIQEKETYISYLEHELATKDAAHAQEREQLLNQIGQLQAELDELKKQRAQP